MKKLGLSVAIASAFTLSACGGGSSSTPVGSGGSVSTGVFLDSAVANIGYRTATQSGVTNASGEYNYLPGETVTFFIGDLELPAVEATGVVTPLTIAGTQDTSNNTVVNITRLLQSLDADGNPDNGIDIPDTAADQASAVDVTQSVAAFESDASIINLIANSGSTNTTIISEEQAIAHFEDTLIDEGETFTPSNSIAGVWATTETENDLLAFVFFQDGTYVHMEVDQDDAVETDGMEWGTYSRDDETGELTLGSTYDIQDTGFFNTDIPNTAGSVFAQVDGDTLTLQFDDNDNDIIDENESLELTRSANSNILGAWVNTATDNDLLSFIFFDNGTYAHLEVDVVAPIDSEGEESGMEWGTYSINPETGALTASIIFDGNDDTGLTDTLLGQIPLFAQVDGDTLTLQFDEDENGSISAEEEFSLSRAAMPSQEVTAFDASDLSGNTYMLDIFGEGVLIAELLANNTTNSWFIDSVDEGAGEEETYQTEWSLVDGVLVFGSESEGYTDEITILSGSPENGNTAIVTTDNGEVGSFSGTVEKIIPFVSADLIGTNFLLPTVDGGTYEIYFSNATEVSYTFNDGTPENGTANWSVDEVGRLVIEGTDYKDIIVLTSGTPENGTVKIILVDDGNYPVEYFYSSDISKTDPV